MIFFVVVVDRPKTRVLVALHGAALQQHI